MERNRKKKGQWGWIMGLLAIGAALLLFACDQPRGQSGLANKPPPNVGAIAEVDGSDDTKKEEKKPQAGAEHTPSQAPAGSQPAQTTPKQ